YVITSGCNPNVVTFSTLINGLCKLHEKMASGKDHGDGFKCRPSLIWCGAIIVGLCEEGLITVLGNESTDKWEEAKGLFNEMTDQVTFKTSLSLLLYQNWQEEATRQNLLCLKSKGYRVN
ncbi:hypothetical protein G4B88_024750, partial [Cannabis sativa]